jgi:hypothetical protein
MIISPINRFIPGEKAPGLSLNKLDVSRVGLDAVVKRKKVLSCWELNPDTLVVSHFLQ